MPNGLTIARRVVVTALPVVLVAALSPATALAAGPIDTSGAALAGYFGITRYSPSDFDNAGSSVAQTFTAPAGVSKVTSFGARVSVGGNSDPMPAADQPAFLELHDAGPTGPANAALKTQPIVLTLGTSSLRTYTVDWPVNPGSQYAAVIRVATADVKAEVNWRVPANQAGTGGLYDGGTAYSAAEEPSPTWTEADRDLSFRIVFDGQDGTTPTTPETPTTPTTPTTTTTTTPSGTTTPPSTPAAVTLTTLPAAKLALRAAGKKKGVAASYGCVNGRAPRCQVGFTAPAGAKRAAVKVLRGSLLVADGSVRFGKSRKATKRTIGLTQRVSAAPGKYVVRLTFVDSAGKTRTQSASFTVPA